jgi:photosystem II stability/assembly factor-like uncharacterized protein
MKNNLTFEQVREAKDRCEEAVKAAITAFEEDTGLCVTSLGFNFDYVDAGRKFPQVHLSARGAIGATVQFGNDSYPF